jgi:hypothetical protein
MVKKIILGLLLLLGALEASIHVRDYLNPDWGDKYAVSYNYGC